MNYEILTESEIELRVERQMDKLDRKLMQGEITQSEYEREVFILDKWSAQQYKAQEQAA
jgi:hypothetical protein